MKVKDMYHQHDMESKHEDITVVTIVDSKYWHITLEGTVEYIRGFRGMDVNLLS